VIEGEAEVWVENECVTVTRGQSVLIPAGDKHGFRNSGDDILFVQATLAAPIFEATYDDKAQPSRRWVAGLGD